MTAPTRKLTSPAPEPMSRTCIAAPIPAHHAFGQRPEYLGLVDQPFISAAA
jgi:hypothetical protein